MSATLLVSMLVLAACGGSGSSHKAEPKSERAREAEELKSGHRTLFESDRRPDHTPAIEAVDSRAYPRHYVETRRALAARKAVTRARTRAAARRARTRAAAASWQEAGPFTPTVPARVTYTGRETMDSGRVTAMAIDPNCGKRGKGGRIWVGAAGGGVWRTANGLAATPTWAPASDGMESNAIGSLTVDPHDASGNPLYAGTGEPNGSGDSEAGVGLYRSSNGGTSWTLVGGSRAVSIDRSIGAVLVDPADPSHLFIGTDVAPRRSAPPEPPVHRPRRGPPRLLERERRPPHPAQRADAGDLRVQGRRRELNAGVQPAAEPGAGLRRRRLVPGRHQQDGRRPVRPDHGLRGHRRLRDLAPLAASGRWPRLASRLRHALRQGHLRRPHRVLADAQERPYPRLRGRQLRRPGDRRAVADRPGRSAGQEALQRQRQHERVDEAVQQEQRHAGLHVVQLLPERAVRLRRLRRGRPDQPGRRLAGRLDGLRRAGHARADQALERARGGPLDGRRRLVRRHDERRALAGPGNAPRPARDRVRPEQPADRVRRL